MYVNEGYVNGKIEISRVDPSDATSRSSMLEHEEIIFTIPTDCLLNASNKDDESSGTSTMNYQLVRNLVREMKHGDDSKYALYVNYCLSQRGQLNIS